jgi:asparagine synthase (glutamine-hydrolysing)
MSAIAGVYHPGTPKPVDRARVLAMADAMAHRGPDGAGVWTAPGIGLAHRRRIVLKDDDQSQPLTIGDLTLVLDGTIYNSAEVRAELERLDGRVEIPGDAALLLHAWRAWGPAMLDRLNGDFALALHDAGAKRLFLARDRLGAKPLHCVELSDGSVAFASELKGLLAHPLLRRSPDLRAIDDFMGLGYVPDDACLLAGVRKLPPAHFLMFERGRAMPMPQRWWTMDFTRRATGSVKGLQGELLDRLRSAVRLRLSADMAPGALLSGGIDSAAMLALMAETSKGAVATCTIGVSGAQDERALAASISARFHARHVEGSLAAEDVGLPELDDPAGDPSAVLTARLYRLAREQMTVAVSGDGADEIFGGYSRYRRLALYERTRSLLPDAVREGALRRLGHALAEDGADDYVSRIAATPFALRRTLYDSKAKAALKGHRVEDRYAATMRGALANDPMGRAQYADALWALPGNVLAQTDRIGMTLGLEVRQPFLDHNVAEFAAALPPSARLRGGQGKWLMRKAMERHVPRDIARRPQAGFVAPLNIWLARPLANSVSDLIHSPRLREWLDAGAIEQLITTHRSGRSDHGRTIWQLLMLDRSLKRLFG